jgi:hypothetical protein
VKIIPKSEVYSELMDLIFQEGGASQVRRIDLTQEEFDGLYRDGEIQSSLTEKTVGAPVCNTFMGIPVMIVEPV